MEKQTSGTSIQVLITDVVMPRICGKELTDRLLRRHPHLKVLYCSGHSEDTLLEHGVQPEKGGFLQKPFTHAVLAHKLRELLD
jgi:FixJ family two-component response regulator